ncbi:MAG: hypothetical protein QNI90_13370 [Dinoroseobacter sp.]|nr:hypothetical protein [Dinoroseobacter sp.]
MTQMVAARRMRPALTPPTPSDRQRAVAQSRAVDILRNSKSFQALHPQRQAQVRADTEKVMGFIADAGAAEMLGLGPARAQSRRRGTARALEGEEQTDTQYLEDSGMALANIVQAVDFPGFVSDLVQGVFQAVVDASIQQMEAYAELVANVSKSVDQYMKDNVSEDQGRDYLVNQYPDFFEPDMDSGKIAPKADADPDNAPNFMADLGIPFNFEDADDEEMEKEIVTSARRKIAMDRQQLLATMVMMGLNRIVVTDGQIKAGVKFDLNTETLQKEHFDRQTSFEYSSERKGRTKSKGFWFIKPKTRSSYENKLNITTDTNFESDNERSQDMKVQMTGNVDLRFKSDFFPMEKMTEIFGMDQEVVTQTSRQGRAGGAEQPQGDLNQQLQNLGVPGSQPGGSG